METLDLLLPDGRRDFGKACKSGQCSGCRENAKYLESFDISPLARFIGEARTGWVLRVNLDGDLVELARIPYGVMVGVVFKDYDPAEGVWSITYSRSDVGLCRHGYRSGKANRMYGFPDDPFTPPTPEEKSPQDKALDDFIAKRKAKRERHWSQNGDFSLTDSDRKYIQDAWDRMKKGEAQSEALGNAMSKLIDAEMPFQARRVNYRGPEL